MSEQKPNVEPQATPPLEAKTEKPAEPAKPLYEGLGGPIANAEELAGYAKRLEEQLVQEKAKSVSPAAPVVLPPKAMEPELEELLYSDPKRAVEFIENKVLTKVEAKKAEEKAEAEFWDGFYNENPDLKSSKRIVQSLVKEKLVEYNKLTREQAAKKLAADSRDWVSDIRKSAGVSETEVPQGKPVALGSSGHPAAKAPTAPAAPVSFADQIRKMHNKRRKAL